MQTLFRSTTKWDTGASHVSGGGGGGGGGSGHGFSTMTVISSRYEKVFRLRKNRTLARLIWLTLLNLVLNLPAYVVRVLTMSDLAGTWLPAPYNLLAQKLAFGLSYLHYAVNYVYCTVLVDDSSRRRRCQVAAQRASTLSTRPRPRPFTLAVADAQTRVGSDL